MLYVWCNVIYSWLLTWFITPLFPCNVYTHSWQLQWLLWLSAVEWQLYWSCSKNTKPRGIKSICVISDKQGRSHQIWSDQVGSACIRMLYRRGAWGHASPGKFWNLGAMRLFLRPNLGQYDASRRPNNRVSHSTHCVIHQCTLGHCVGVRHTMALIGNTRQSHEWGEKVVRLKPD